MAATRDDVNPSALEAGQLAADRVHRAQELLSHARAFPGMKQPELHFIGGDSMEPVSFVQIDGILHVSVLDRVCRILQGEED